MGKYRADLYKSGKIPGFIIINEETFKWTPLIGHYREVELPIEDVIGYSKTGFFIWSTLYLEFARYDTIEAFWGGWRVNSLIRELRYRNPDIREFEVKSTGNWIKDYVWFILACIAVVIYSFYVKSGNVDDSKEDETDKKNVEISQTTGQNNPILSQNNQESTHSSIYTGKVTEKKESNLTKLIAKNIGKYPYEIGLSDNKEFSSRLSTLVGSEKYSYLKVHVVLESPITLYDSYEKYGIQFFDKEEQYIYYIIYDKPKDNFTVIMKENGTSDSFSYAQEKQDKTILETFNEDKF